MVTSRRVGSMAHTANFGTASVKEVFSEQSITNRLWPPRSSDLNPCNYNVSWALNVYVNNPHLLQ